MSRMEPKALVSPDEQASLAQQAAVVASYLRWAGLTTRLQGSALEEDYNFVPGALVFYDPLAESPGVYASWTMSDELLAEVLNADPKVLAFGEAAIDSMLAAITTILSTAGWEIDAEDVGVHEATLKVKSTPASPTAPRE
jgi:hypothetical protein